MAACLNGLEFPSLSAAYADLGLPSQETRTLWTNNVEDGVWRGPAQLPTTCPPQLQFVTGTPAPKQIEN